MSTKQGALYEWFNTLGIPFYVNTNVPDDVQFPYGTYENVTGSFGDDAVSITVYLYYYTTGEKEINAMAEKISKAIGLGGVIIPCDDGSIWVKRGTPFCQAIRDDEDQSYKRRYINLEIEYNTI